jgi:hypothetical protein
MAAASSRQETLLQTSLRTRRIIRSAISCRLPFLARPAEVGGIAPHSVEITDSVRARATMALLAPTFLASLVPQALIGDERETWFSKISAAA